MTVKELIEILKQQNQDAIVYHDYDGYRSLSKCSRESRGNGFNIVIN